MPHIYLINQHSSELIAASRPDSEQVTNQGSARLSSAESLRENCLNFGATSIHFSDEETSLFHPIHHPTKYPF
jgi:hypothetical protein